jgi:hypothetical protein
VTTIVVPNTNARQMSAIGLSPGRLLFMPQPR